VWCGEPEALRDAHPGTVEPDPEMERVLLDHELSPLQKPPREGLAQIVGQPVDLDQLGQQLRLGQVRPKRLRFSPESPLASRRLSRACHQS
jgi:hypothetical protein